MTLTARRCHLVGNGGFNTSTSFRFKHFIDAEVLFEAPPTACSPLYGEHHATSTTLWAMFLIYEEHRPHNHRFGF